MKKLLSVLLTCCLLMGIYGCHKQPDTTDTEEPSTSMQQTDLTPGTKELEWTMQGAWVDATGKAGEKVAEIMPIYSINAGGNIVMGESYKAEGWKVGVQDPDAALFISDDPYVCTLQAKNCAIVTSGDYQRFFYADGVAYHHLIDPATNMPAKHYRAVTIVAPDSALADWYSTAAFLLPPEESRALIAAGEGVEAMWIHPDGTVEMTDGFKAMVVTETAE